MRRTSVLRKAIILATNILLPVVMSNCSPVSPVRPSNTPLGNLNAKPMTTNTPIALDQITPAPSRTLTAVQTNIPSTTQMCWHFADSQIPALNGQLVLSGFRLEENGSLIAGQSYLYNLRNGEQTSLGRTKYETVSPVSDWLAFYDNSSGKVVIVDHDGKIFKELNADKSRQFPAYWLDNKNLALNKILENYARADNASLMITNPFTNEQHEWLPEYPQQDHGYYYDWQVVSNLLFNSEFSRLVYPATINGRIAIVMRDVHLEREVARIYGGASKNNTPWWSPDGNYFIVSAPMRWDGQNSYINIDDGFPYVGGSDLLLVSIDGQIKRLTYFTVTNLVGETNFVWSPNSRKIAFLQWDVLHSLEPSLMVVDVETGIVNDYCKLAQPPIDNQNLPIVLPDPIWSPDGRYIVFTEINSEYQYKVRLLELESGRAWDIAEGVSAMGWMIAP